MPAIRISSEGWDDLEDRLTKEVVAIKLREVKLLAQQLEEASPEGGTGELKRGWLAAFRAGETTVVLINTAEDSFERVVGRGPGGSFTKRDILGLMKWVGKVLGEADPKRQRSLAYAIATRITRNGTARWRSKRNVMGYNQDGTLKRNSPVYKTLSALVRALKDEIILK